MTELTQYQPNEATLTTVQPLGTQLIQSAVEQMAGAHQLGVALAGTAFVPRHFQGKPDDVTAAIMFGAALGLDPMSAVRSVYVVSGTPGLYARSMVAVAMSKGHKIWTEETTDTTVTVAGQRRGEERVERVTWTIDRAKKAGYTSNAKYNTDPQAMLWARAAGDVARRIAPDALAGLDYSVEELQVIDHVDVPARPRRESAAALLGTPPATPEPQVVSEPTYADKGEPEKVEAPTAAPTAERPLMGSGPDGATARQVSAINIALKARGIGTKGTVDAMRVEKLAWLSEATAREITSSKDLTKVEAANLLDHFATEDEAAALEPDGSELAAEGGAA